MEKKYQIELLAGGPDYIKTPDDFFKIPFVMLSVAKRMSGKTCSMSQFLHLLNKIGTLDRVILISPTYMNNAHYFKGLPLDEEHDVLEPTLDVAQRVMDILDEEALVYDEYHEKLKKWKELQKILKGRTPIDLIDENLLLFFSDVMEKPKHKYNGRKPVIVAFWDDCQNTEAFSPSKYNRLNYLTIKHRHLGMTAHDKSIGCNLMFACQNYTSNTGGIPKTIRGNTTILCIFSNKNQKELDLIAEECSGEVDVDTFKVVHAKATESDYGFLTIDFNRKKEHKSPFRKCWNEWIFVEELKTQ
jgi:hypothetical protein